MLIELKITAENADDYWNALRGLMPTPPAFVVSPDVNVDTAPAPTARKTRNKPAPEPEMAKPAEQPAEPAEASAQVDEPELPLENTTPAPEPVKLDNGLMKAFAVRYVNDMVAASGTTGQSEQQAMGKSLFQELLKPFGVTKFSEIPDDKLGEIHDTIVETRKTNNLDPLDIAELAAKLAAK